MNQDYHEALAHLLGSTAHLVYMYITIEAKDDSQQNKSDY